MYKATINAYSLAKMCLVYTTAKTGFCAKKQQYSDSESSNTALQQEAEERSDNVKESLLVSTGKVSLTCYSSNVSKMV